MTAPFPERKGAPQRTVQGEYGLSVLSLILFKLFFFARIFLFTLNCQVKCNGVWKRTSKGER